LYSIADPNWNVVAVANASGAVVERLRYDAFGKITWLDAAFAVKANSAYAWNRTFTGQVFDAETGLMLYRNRYYHTELGRFTQRDPIGYRGSGLNLLRYSHNKPLIYTDPSGSTGEKPEKRPIEERRQECCTELKRQIDVGLRPDNKGADGMTICCGDTPVSCIFTDGNSFQQMTNERAKAVFAICTQFHESQHVWDAEGRCPECPESDTAISNPYFPYLEGDTHPSAPRVREECRAMRTELACLLVAILACGNDVECSKLIRDYSANLKKQADAACIGLDPYNPYLT